MPTSLSLAEHLATIEWSGRHLLDAAVRAGLDAPVPTCPAWRVDALLAHQTMVHRWAAANIRGDDPDAVPNQTTIRTTVPDLPGYYAEGLELVLAALREAPADLKAMTFLRDAPSPREFWARRQAHETTIHMVDALSAVHGRSPTTAEAGIDPGVALDGIDELLRGFYTRGRTKLYEGEEYDVVVAPSDSPRRWLVHVAEQLSVHPGNSDASAAAHVSGPAASLYLALWNRGDEITVTGKPELLDRWRKSQRVTWS